MNHSRSVGHVQQDQCYQHFDVPGPATWVWGRPLLVHAGTPSIVPLAELRRLRAVERHASREALEEAEIEATLAAHDEWVATGCPGARSHEDVASRRGTP